jgi:hypothetical protein
MSIPRPIAIATAPKRCEVQMIHLRVSPAEARQGQNSEGRTRYFGCEAKNRSRSRCTRSAALRSARSR